MHGFIVLNKEKGITSFKAAAKVRRLLNVNKIGHTGTLDPDSEGVLVLAIGRATKSISLITNNQKHYIAEALIGLKTTTGDISGSIISSSCVNELDSAFLDDKIAVLAASKTQIPPKYSAIKVNGKKLYEYARENKEVALPVRNININLLKRTSELTFRDDCCLFTLEIIADEGIYIRSLIEDLGDLIGQPATMNSLVRLKSGDFCIEDASTVDEIAKNDYKLIPLDSVFQSYERIDADGTLAKAVSNGSILDESVIKVKKHLRIYDNNELLALYHYDSGKYFLKVLVKD